ncbi:MULTISPECIES: NfeD family protein [unclassified Gilliamella]|uniref:NfeD family protein n=1 Tax=unclassified Gilliamella TaxID=2685620 RepID=UPI001C6998E2|nr:NfeD family protein [Gilliamella sp. ESL0441]QYN44776.1 NfeD family protein [Gilliamella sp. ESL0441]
MADNFTVIYYYPHWIFIALGGILLIAELLGTGGYLLWSGIAAISVGLIAWFIPFLSWPILWILFSILTLVSAYLWYVWLKSKGKHLSKKGELNQPQHDLIGIKTVVTDAIVNGSGRVKIKDGTWSARCNKDLSVGQSVVVTSVDGIILNVEPVI